VRLSGGGAAFSGDGFCDDDALCDDDAMVCEMVCASDGGTYAGSNRSLFPKIDASALTGLGKTVDNCRSGVASNACAYRIPNHQLKVPRSRDYVRRKTYLDEMFPYPATPPDPPFQCRPQRPEIHIPLRLSLWNRHTHTIPTLLRPRRDRLQPLLFPFPNQCSLRLDPFSKDRFHQIRVGVCSDDRLTSE
jgi:hypothetical protein